MLALSTQSDMNGVRYSVEYAVIDGYCVKHGMDSLEVLALCKMMCGILSEK